MLDISSRAALNLIRAFKARGGHVLDMAALYPQPPQRAKKFTPRVPVASFHQMLAQMAGITVPGRHSGRRIQQEARQQRERSPEQRKRDKKKLQALRQARAQAAGA